MKNAPQLIITAKYYVHGLGDLLKSIDNIMHVSDKHLDAAFLAGMKTIIEPSESSIFSQILGNFHDYIQ